MTFEGKLLKSEEKYGEGENVVFTHKFCENTVFPAMLGFLTMFFSSFGHHQSVLEKKFQDIVAYDYIKLTLTG